MTLYLVVLLILVIVGLNVGVWLYIERTQKKTVVEKVDSRKEKMMAIRAHIAARKERQKKENS